MFDDVVVMLRPDDTPLTMPVDERHCRPCVNPNPQQGMGSSLACGVRAAPDPDGWLVMPDDLPLVWAQDVDTPEDAQRLTHRLSTEQAGTTLEATPCMTAR